MVSKGHPSVSYTHTICCRYIIACISDCNHHSYLPACITQHTYTCQYLTNYTHTHTHTHTHTARNILVKKTCDCGDLLHCDCHLDSKFAVQIADFDSAKQTKSPRKPDQFANKVTSGIQQTQGTPGYRAPEVSVSLLVYSCSTYINRCLLLLYYKYLYLQQFKLCPKLKDFEKVLQDGEKRYDMEGPWCDIWSLGVMVVQMVDGSEDEKRKCHKEVCDIGYNQRIFAEKHIYLAYELYMYQNVCVEQVQLSLVPRLSLFLSYNKHELQNRLECEI